MSEFRKYRRTNIAEMRPYKEAESLSEIVSISQADFKAGSPKLGDMIARNPANHNDQWLVAREYFLANFEPYHASDPIADKLAEALNAVAADDYRMAESCALHELLDDKISIAKQALSEYQAMKNITKN